MYMKRFGSRLMTISLLALLALFMACGGDPTAPETTTTNPDLDGDGILNAVDQCPNQPETFNGALDGDGCPDTTKDLYVLARQLIEEYWDVLVFTDGSYRDISLFQEYTQPILTPCDPNPVPLDNAFYCPVNEGVYYDINFLDSWLTTIGDMAPVFIIAHEIGHHVGITLLNWIPGVVFKPSGFVLSTKESELMADCFAGGFVAAADLAGLLEPGDLEEAVQGVINAGDPASTWFDPTAHGTAVQRVLAFAIGFDEGPVACTVQNFFNLFPEPPPEQ